MSTAQYFSIVTDQLPIGCVAHHQLLDQAGQVLLDESAVVTQDFLYRLKKNQIRDVFVHSDDRKSWGLAATGGKPLSAEKQKAQSASSSPLRICFESDKIIKVAQPMIEAVEREMRRLRSTSSSSQQQRIGPKVVPVVPVTETYTPVDTPFEGVLGDLNSHDALLFHSRAISTKFLVMELGNPNQKCLQLAMEIQNKQTVGRFYALRCKLVARLE